MNAIRFMCACLLACGLSIMTSSFCGATAQVREIPTKPKTSSPPRQVQLSNFDRHALRDKTACLDAGQDANYCQCVSDRSIALGKELSAKSGGRDPSPAYSSFHARAENECARDSGFSGSAANSIFSPDNEAGALGVLAQAAEGRCQGFKSDTRMTGKIKDRQNAIDCSCMGERSARLALTNGRKAMESHLGSNASTADLEEFAEFYVSNDYNAIIHEFEFRESTGGWTKEGSPEAQAADACILQHYSYTMTPTEKAAAGQYGSDLEKTRAMIEATCEEGAARPVPMTHFGQFYDCKALAATVDTSFEEANVDQNTFITRHVTWQNAKEFATRDHGKIRAGISSFCNQALSDAALCSCVAEKGATEIVTNSAVRPNNIDRTARIATGRYAQSCR